MGEAEATVTSYVVDDDILVIKLRGKLNERTVPLFKEQVEKLFAEGKRKVIIDCAHLGVISSYGIGTIVSLQGKLRKLGGEVKLAAIQSVVADVFKIVRLDKLFDMYGDIEFARQSFYE